MGLVGAASLFTGLPLGLPSVFFEARRRSAAGITLGPDEPFRSPSTRESREPTGSSLAAGTRPGAALLAAGPQQAAVAAVPATLTLEQRRRRLAGRGRAPGILTSTGGVLGAAPVARKVLLGE